MKRRLGPLAALAMLTLIGAGCSGTGSSSGTNTAASSSGGNNNDTATRGQAVKFAECMRDNGVGEFPDQDTSGQFADGIEQGSSLDASTAAWKRRSASVRTCSHRACWAAK